MKFFNYNFLFVSSFTLEFGVAVLTTVFTVLTLSVVMVNVSELSKNLIVLGSIFLLLLTWGIAIAGALLRSRKLIALTIVIWAIFIIEWLVLSLYFRVLMHNINYCVAQNTRCAPTMWLIGGGVTGSDDNTDAGDDDNSTDGDSEQEDENRRRLWSIIDSPKLTVKTFHPMKTNVIPNTIATTPTVDIVISNQTSTMVGVNNGCGCERHLRTTTESPPSDLITRVIEYRKNMTMYRQTSEAAIQLQKKKGGEKNEVPSVEEYYDGDDITREHHKKKGYDSKIVKTAEENNSEDKGEDGEDNHENDDSDDDETEEKGKSTNKTADCKLVDLLAMAFFLLSRRNRMELDFLVGFLTTSYYISYANACFMVDQTGYPIYTY